MVSTFVLVTECPATSDRMFELSLNIDAHLESMKDSGEQAVGGVTSGQIGLGQTVTWRARHGGIWFTMTSKITAFEHSIRFVDEQVKGPFKSFVHEHAFEEIPGGCRMTDTVTLAAPAWGRFAERGVLVPYLRRLIRRRNVTLVGLVG